MARLSSRMRKSIPKSKFGLPGQRKYPMPDKAHAKVAKAYATRFASRGERAKIDAKANKILGKPKKSKGSLHDYINSQKKG